MNSLLPPSMALAIRYSKLLESVADMRSPMTKALAIVFPTVTISPMLGIDYPTIPPGTGKMSLTFMSSVTLSRPLALMLLWGLPIP